MLVGYARVSALDHDPAIQLTALKDAGCERIFTESEPGAQKDRPELSAALDLMEAGDVLVVWRLDRLARSLKQLVETVALLEDRRVGFRSLTEGIDTSLTEGGLIFQLFGALAHFDRSVIRERARTGQAAARAQGRTGGRPPVLDENGRAQGLAQLRDPRIPIREIAANLNISVSTLYKYFPNGRSGIGREHR